MTQPLFIICPGRTFSSVVCAVIGQHPQAFGLPEVNLFKTLTVGDLMGYNSQVFGQQAVTSGLKRTIAELKFGAQTVDTIDRATEWITERSDLTGRQMFHLIQEMAGGRVIVDKSPTNSHHDALARIVGDFPDAKFLHIARHPRATCKSQHKAFTSKKRFAGRKFDFEKHWFDRHSNCMALGERLGPAQYMFLHGEWFFEEPASILQQIAEWLGLSFDEEAIALMMRPEDGPFSRPGPDNAKGGNNKGFLEKPHLRIGKIRTETLDGPLEWRPDDDAHFSQPTRNLAHQMGYGE